MIWLYHWCLANGVQGNLAASAILGVPTAILSWKPVRRHLRKVHEIHRHLDPNDDFTIGS